MSTSINNLSSGPLYQADGLAAYQHRRQSFEALAQALQSNDLPAAKQAFAALQVRHKHHHHDGNQQPDASPAGSPQTSTASDTSNKIDISA